MKAYTEQEKQFIKDNVDKLSYKEIASILNRGALNVAQFAKSKLGISKARIDTVGRYTEYEKQFIIDNVNLLSYQEIAIALNRSITSVSRFAKEKLGVDKTRVNAIRPKNQYTEQEERFLRDNHSSMTSNELGKHLNGRSAKAINEKLNYMGLRHIDRKGKGWIDPSIPMVKRQLCLSSKLKPEDIPDSLAEIQRLNIKLKKTLAYD